MIETEHLEMFVKSENMVDAPSCRFFAIQVFVVVLGDVGFAGAAGGNAHNAGEIGQSRRLCGFRK